MAQNDDLFYTADKVRNVLPCTCASTFQDSRYGPGMRVHTVGRKNSALRCTVCNGKKPLVGKKG